MIIQILNKLDRYIAKELILSDTNEKYPKNEVFIVDDVYEALEEIAAQDICPEDPSSYLHDLSTRDYYEEVD